MERNRGVKEECRDDRNYHEPLAFYLGQAERATDA